MRTETTSALWRAVCRVGHGGVTARLARPTTVETAIRILGRWIRDGIVCDDGGHLVVRDIDRLREVATDD